MKIVKGIMMVCAMLIVLMITVSMLLGFVGEFLLML